MDARVTARQAPHWMGFCPDKEAAKERAEDRHKDRCRWPLPFLQEYRQWRWSRLYTSANRLLKRVQKITEYY